MGYKEHEEQKVNEHDFLDNQEIAVRITLSEYRSLVSEVAALGKENHFLSIAKYKADDNLENTKKALEAIKKEVTELQEEISECRKINEILRNENKKLKSAMGNAINEYEVE